ncbi:MAG: chaperone NapD [Coriobacteriia bacterium]|nr:chaperone NapD [Coriobacteriia bacterium]MCL2750299.1 chaperone NapD [Coriobacteriia bacterium]
MTNFTENTQENEVTAAQAAVTASELTSSGPEEDVVISSYLVSTFQGETAQAAEAISQIAGVEVHETHDTTLVVTIEAPTIAASTKVATEVNLTKGVVTVRLIFANFEDDPIIKRQLEINRAKKVLEDELEKQQAK